MRAMNTFDKIDNTAYINNYYKHSGSYKTGFEGISYNDTTW